jgi:hypothetical protein
MTEPIQLLPGDIMATRGRGRLARLILFLTRSRGEAKTKVNHVGLVVQGGTLGETVIVEALQHVMRRRLAVGYGKPDSPEVTIWRCAVLTGEDRDAICAWAEKQVGRRYGYVKLLSYLPGWFGKGLSWIPLVTGGQVCSNLVAYAFGEEGLFFGVEPGRATPDDILDFAEGHPAKYREVVPLGPLSTLLAGPGGTPQV